MDGEGGIISVLGGVRNRIRRSGSDDMVELLGMSPTKARCFEGVMRRNGCVPCGRGIGREQS